MRALTLATAAALGLGAFAPSHGQYAAPAILDDRLPAIPKPPRVKGKKPSVRTHADRIIGGDADPYFGIASKGRNGARERSRKMEAARLTKTRHSRKPGRVFKSDKREAEFVACLALGWSRNIALKKARRIAA
jgi:hypothetical protein